MNDEMQKLFDQFPKPPADAVFELRKVDIVALPHPYCITPKHLLPGRMILDAASIREAEKKGAVCDICRVRHRKNGDRILNYDEHEQVKSLFIAVPKGNNDLNAVPGLHAYLFGIKEQATKLGVDGFAFPSK